NPDGIARLSPVPSISGGGTAAGLVPRKYLRGSTRCRCGRTTYEGGQTARDSAQVRWSAPGMRSPQMRPGLVTRRKMSSFRAHDDRSGCLDLAVDFGNLLEPRLAWNHFSPPRYFPGRVCRF